MVHPDPTGMNPAGDLETKDNVVCTYVKCPSCGAALALQVSGSVCRHLAENDIELHRVVLAWSSLPEVSRKAIAGLVRLHVIG